MMRPPLCLLASLALAFTACAQSAVSPSSPITPASVPVTSAAKPAALGLPLFNGKDFAGWEFTATPAPTPPAEINQLLHYAADGVIAAAGQPVGFLATTATYDKGYRLHVEWRWTQKAGTPNGGVLLHISSGPKNNTEWPLSFQVQTKNKAAGDLLPMSGGTFAEPLTSAAGAAVPIRAHAAPDSEKPLGEWNTADIICRADTIEVTINGVLQNKISKAVPATGKIGFQFEGQPFELRNVRLAPLDASNPQAALPDAVRKRLIDLTGFLPELTSIVSVEKATTAEGAVPFLSNDTSKRSLLKITYAPYRLKLLKYPDVSDQRERDWVVIMDADTGTLISIKTRGYDQAAIRSYLSAEMDMIHQASPPGSKALDDIPNRGSDLEFGVRVTGKIFVSFSDQIPKKAFLAVLNPIAPYAQEIAAYYVMVKKWDYPVGQSPYWMINLIGVPGDLEHFSIPARSGQSGVAAAAPKFLNNTYSIDAMTGEERGAVHVPMPDDAAK